MDEPKKLYFKVWADWKDKIEPLDLESRGELFTALIEYINGEGNSSLSTNAKYLFPTLKSIIDFDIEKSESAAAAHREAGKLGGRPKKDVQSNIEKPKGFSNNQKVFYENQTKADKEKDKDKDYISPPVSPSRGTARADELFDRFWAVYPRKAGKDAAIKAWGKIKPDAQLTDVIVKAVENQRCSEQWRRDNGQYIPYPATWLNGRRWEDEEYTSSSFCRREEPDISDIFVKL